ncbi:MAG: pectinesterase family protein [Saprospiraceae bacterium]
MQEAFEAVKNSSNSSDRFYIFFPNGEYDLGKTTGDATGQTFFYYPNVSFIGQNMDSVVLYNEPVATDEGIGTTPTLNFTTDADNIYMQDLTLLNKMDFRTGSFTGRAVALRDQGDKSIFKNVKLLSNQDTYYTGTDRSYWENGEIHGTVDFIFGGGDVYFNETNIFLEDRTNNHITAAATQSDWGYVFNNCYIDGFETANGNYKLGRPWQNKPRTVYINTTMNILPAAEGWSTWNTIPGMYAEYNSVTPSGTPIDLSNRRSVYTTETDTVELNPILTTEMAETFTIKNVLSGDDSWQPTLYTEQAPAPVISSSNEFTWENDDYVLGWAVFKDGVFQDFVTQNSYNTNNVEGTYYIRAANEMGGLGEPSIEIFVIGGNTDDNELDNIISVYPNPTHNILVLDFKKNITDGTIEIFTIEGQRIYSSDINNQKMEIDTSSFKSGNYFAYIKYGTKTIVKKIVKQ